MLNHLPLLGRNPAHAIKGDTSNPHGAITCPKCRAMLQAKVDAHCAFKGSAQERKFFADDAAAWSRALAKV
jgi:hypothetical protein